jgi:hypothetical protein
MSFELNASGLSYSEAVSKIAGWVLMNSNVQPNAQQIKILNALRLARRVQLRSVEFRELNDSRRCSPL